MSYSLIELVALCLVVFIVVLLPLLSLFFSAYLFHKLDIKFTYINEIFKGYLEATSNQDKQRRLKKRLDKSSQELCDYVDYVINRDTVDIDSPEQTDTIN